MKYDIQQGANETVRIGLTAVGRVREFLAAVVVVAPWTIVGMGVLFLPDFVFNYREKGEAVLSAFWWMAALILLAVCLFFGLRRSLGTRYWEVDPVQGVVRRHARTWTGRRVVDLEVPMDAISPLEQDGGRVGFKLPGGSEQIVARSCEPDELRAVERALFGVP